MLLAADEMIDWEEEICRWEELIIIIITQRLQTAFLRTLAPKLSSNL